MGFELKLSAHVILGIESSCDDTAAAIVSYEKGNSKILSSVVVNQNTLHEKYGGVVPEIAARAHAERVDTVVTEALAGAKLSLLDINLIGVTAGPGLIGGVVAGVMCAKGLAYGANLPLVGVNHLAGHALTPRLTGNLEYPYLILLASGGHCQFVIVESANKFSRLGGTIDDAPGEAFDKTARLLGLEQPGGPSIEREAINGDFKRFDFPRPLLNRDDCDMSFSGLKTAVSRSLEDLDKQQGGLYERDVKDFCASFQAAISDVLVGKSKRAIIEARKRSSALKTFAIVGGVAANEQIRQNLSSVCNDLEIDFIAPPLELCTDNAAMIAYAAGELYDLGQEDDYSLSPRSRWPLDEKNHQCWEVERGELKHDIWNYWFRCFWNRSIDFFII